MIIGFTGKAAAGKDTCADWLVAHRGFRKLSWAGPLKAALTILGFPEPENRDDKEKPVAGFGFTWREAAQTLGTEWGRSLDPDLWIKIVGKQMQAEPDVNWVVSDCRFNNETAMIRSLGGQVIHLQGRAADLGERAGHVSEAGVEILPGDIVIPNDGTKTELFFKLQNSITYLGKK